MPPDEPDTVTHLCSGSSFLEVSMTKPIMTPEAVIAAARDVHLHGGEELWVREAHPVVKSSHLHSSRCAWLPIQWCAPEFSVAGIPGYRKAVGVQDL